MRKKIKFNIRAKIMLGYIFVILCLGATIGMAMDRISTRQEAINYITDHDIQVHKLLDQLEKATVDMETGQRGFVITGDEKYLDPYKEGNDAWLDAYNKLHVLFADNPSQQQALESVKPVMEHWIANAGEYLIDLKRQNKSAELLEWFKMDSGKKDVDQMRSQFDAIRETETRLTAQRAADLLGDYQNLKVVLFVILFLVTLVSLLVAAFISGVISKTIKRVTATIQNIASSKGALAQRIHVRTNDEIKDLAKATNALLGSLEEQSWVKTSVTDVATAFQGMLKLDELSGAIVRKLAPLLGATYGVIYVHKDQGGQPRYSKMASYACSDSDSTPVSFKPGEGLVGQAIVDKRVFLLRDVPDTYVRVSSGLGHAAPRSILIVPIMFEGHVEAVLELASFETFGKKHIAFVEQIGDTLGTAISSVRGRMEVERLLNESQMLTEELQAQSEELQAQSEELQMQQDQLRISNEFLEEHNHFMEQKAAELKKAKEELEVYAVELERSSRFKSEFLANMSHELRTPLNSILILSQMLAENDGARLSEEEEEYSRVIYTAGKDLLTLIDDILDLSKVEAGKIDIRVDEVNLTELPELLNLVFEPIASRKGVSFLIESHPNMPDLMATDGQRLQQILKNLLSNAFKFTEQGSVTFKMERVGADQLKHGMAVNPGELVIAFSVTDTGIGIPADKQQMIFEAFQQADGTTNRQFGGTGLGLSICREFSRLLGGSIIVESQPGAGSTFTLYLPELKEGGTMVMAQGQVAAAASPSLSEAMPAPRTSIEAEDSFQQATAEEMIADPADTKLFTGKKVLLVDDDERNVFALVTALGNKGVIVKVADNGRQAVERLRETPEYDLVLMDIMMPVMDGYEAMHAIRSELGLQELPIIALTAKAMKNAREQCMKAGASDYISKPLNMDQFFSLMRVWLTKQVNRK
ncbi:MAG: sensor hybrid histidine kinase [Paenibacillus sp.]|nr:sensor hybrid histidine kinase [Paenibacillus sp.]